MFGFILHYFILSACAIDIAASGKTFAYEPCNNVAGKHCNKYRAHLFGTARAGTDESLHNLVAQAPAYGQAKVVSKAPAVDQPARATFTINEPFHASGINCKDGVIESSIRMLNCLYYCNCTHTSPQPNFAWASHFEKQYAKWFGVPAGNNVGAAYDKLCRGHYNIDRNESSTQTIQTAWEHSVGRIDRDS